MHNKMNLFISKFHDSYGPTSYTSHTGVEDGESQNRKDRLHRQNQIV